MSELSIEDRAEVRKITEAVGTLNELVSLMLTAPTLVPAPFRAFTPSQCIQMLLLEAAKLLEFAEVQP